MEEYQENLVEDDEPDDEDNEEDDEKLTKQDDDDNEVESLIKKPKFEFAKNSASNDPIIILDSSEYFSQKKIDFTFSN